MGKINPVVERFLTKITKEFTNEELHVEIEEVKDTHLRKKWYNVIWYKPNYDSTIIEYYYKFIYRIKSKTYNNEKDAIEHFKQIIKSQLK